MNERIVCTGFAAVTVADWQVLRATVPLDVATAATLRDYLAPLLAGAAEVAIDLRRQGVDAEAVDALAALSNAAVASGAHLVVVAEGAETREALRAAGVAHVHESLDAGLHDDAAALRTPHDPERTTLYPAAGDATLVAAQDIADVTDR